MDKRKKNIIELTRVSLEDYKSREKLPITLVVDSVRSMNNIGSFFRTADAFLIDEIVLCGISATPPHPDIHKTALGAENSVKWSYEPQATDAIERLKRQGFLIVALEQTLNSIMLDDFRPLAGNKYAIIVGNEVSGVAQEAVDVADYVLEIPQCGIKHSLNVSVSAGIAMWHFFKALK